MCVYGVADMFESMGPVTSGGFRRGFEEEEQASDDALGAALQLMDEGYHEAADGLLTLALATGEGEGDPELWMAAGIARMHRGAKEAAKSAFRMCRWLNGDPLATELEAALG